MWLHLDVICSSWMISDNPFSSINRPLGRVSIQKLRSRSRQGTSTTLLSTPQYIVTDPCVETNCDTPGSWREFYEKVQLMHFRSLHFATQRNTIVTLGGVFAAKYFLRVKPSSEIKVGEGDGCNASMAKVLIQLAYPTIHRCRNEYAYQEECEAWGSKQ